MLVFPQEDAEWKFPSALTFCFLSLLGQQSPSQTITKKVTKGTPPPLGITFHILMSHVTPSFLSCEKTEMAKLL